MLAAWLDLPSIAIHILLDRSTGKTLSHCLVELSPAHARMALRICQNKLIGEGRRRRAVSVTMSGQAELMREVNVLRLACPFVRKTDANQLSA